MWICSKPHWKETPNGIPGIYVTTHVWLYDHTISYMYSSSNRQVPWCPAIMADPNLNRPPQMAFRLNIWTFTQLCMVPRNGSWQNRPGTPQLNWCLKQGFPRSHQPIQWLKESGKESDLGIMTGIVGDHDRYQQRNSVSDLSIWWYFFLWLEWGRENHTWISKQV